MAPTVCSDKKRQTHAIATNSIRRQLNQTLSNIVSNRILNFVATGSVNPRVSASLRIQSQQTDRSTDTTGNYSNRNHEADLNYNNNNHSTLQGAGAAPASYHRRQQISFISDNAITSSTHSDTENSFDLRLANEILNNDSTAASSSSASSSSQSVTSLSSTATGSSSHQQKTSSPPVQCLERTFQRYSFANQQQFSSGEESDNDSGNEQSDSSNNSNANKEIHSRNIRKYYFSCNDFDYNEDDEDIENDGETDSDISGGIGSDDDMDTDDSDSMTSLDTEKSAKLKRCNQPLLRDKLLREQQTNENNNNNNTDGLMLIAIKTLKLVKRNQLLQERLSQLQLETSEFIQSVLANPENQHFQQNIKQKVQEVDD